MLILRIFSESFASAVHELLVNRLRTFLTLMGISIGIFCVITIFSAVDSLENNLKTSIDKFGNDIVYISKAKGVTAVPNFCKKKETGAYKS